MANWKKTGVIRDEVTIPWTTLTSAYNPADILVSELNRMKLAVQKLPGAARRALVVRLAVEAEKWEEVEGDE